MPIINQLLREGRVFFSTYSDVYTLAEVTEMINFLQHEVLPHATKKVHTISDFTAVKRLPPNSLGSAIQMMKRKHPMIGTVVLVTPNEFIHKMVNILVKLTPATTVVSCRTIEEAFAEVDRLLASETQESVPQNQA